MNATGDKAAAMPAGIRFTAYDTLCSIRVYDPVKKEILDDLFLRAQDAALNLERTLSMFDENSELSRLCRTYRPGVPCAVSSLVQRFLSDNLEFSEKSDGAFDPTVGPLVKLWNFLDDDPQVPSPQALEAARAVVGYRHIALNRNAGTVTFDIPGIVLDPGASGKGLSLGITADILRSGEVTDAVLDFGGNLFILGDNPDSHKPWRVGIRDPDHADKIIGTVPLANSGIATSSWYEHCFSKNGVIYHHLLDPRTGMPVPLELKSVSILSSRAVYTDLLSTAFFILGEQKGAQLAESLRQDSGERIDYVAVRKDGSIFSSEHANFHPFMA